MHAGVGPSGAPVRPACHCRRKLVPEMVGRGRVEGGGAGAVGGSGAGPSVGAGAASSPRSAAVDGAAGAAASASAGATVAVAPAGAAAGVALALRPRSPPTSTPPPAALASPVTPPLPPAIALSSASSCSTSAPLVILPLATSAGDRLASARYTRRGTRQRPRPSASCDQAEEAAVPTRARRSVEGACERARSAAKR